MCVSWLRCPISSWIPIEQNRTEQNRTEQNTTIQYNTTRYRLIPYAYVHTYMDRMYNTLHSLLTLDPKLSPVHTDVVHLHRISVFHKVIIVWLDMDCQQSYWISCHLYDWSSKTLENFLLSQRVKRTKTKFLVIFSYFSINLLISNYVSNNRKLKIRFNI